MDRIRAVDPSVTVLYEPELLPPERFPADHAGDPDFSRTPEQEERYWEMLNRAQVLYGFPNESPAGLARIATSNPHLQWVHAMAAGAGGAVKASGLDTEILQKFKVTTSAGVHALPLAEFAALGILNGFKRSAELAQDQAAKVWPELRTPTRLVSGSRLVITGLGEIGLETARIARALGMNVSGTKRTVEAIERHRRGDGQRRPRRPPCHRGCRGEHPARHAVHGEALQPRGLRRHEARHGLRQRRPRHRGG